MTTHTPLDLRGTTMSELMQMNADNGDYLDEIKADGLDVVENQEYVAVLADRRQIRAEMGLRIMQQQFAKMMGE